MDYKSINEELNRTSPLYDSDSSRVARRQNDYNSFEAERKAYSNSLSSKPEAPKPPEAPRVQQVQQVQKPVQQVKITETEPKAESRMVNAVKDAVKDVVKGKVAEVVVKGAIMGIRAYTGL